MRLVCLAPATVATDKLNVLTEVIKMLVLEIELNLEMGRHNCIGSANLIGGALVGK